MKSAGAFVLGLVTACLLSSCAGERSDLDPSPPARIGELQVLENPPAASETWLFVESVDSWSVGYTDAAGEILLRVYAFLFADVASAKSTYETSRIKSATGTGNYSESGQVRIGGTSGLRLVDGHGVYFLYRRGAWLIVLSAAKADRFAEAVHAIEWAPQQ